MGVKPSDILPNNINEIIINGVKVRKGTVAAVMANDKILMSKTSTESEKTKAKEIIRDLMPSVIAIGVHEHLTWKNPEVQNLMESFQRQQVD